MEIRLQSHKYASVSLYGVVAERGVNRSAKSRHKGNFTKVPKLRN